MRSMQSVQNQVYNEHEHVIVFDGDLPEMLNRQRIIGYSFPVSSNVRTFRTGKRWQNFGNTPRCVGSVLAVGEYVTYLDDDVYYKKDTVLRDIGEAIRKARHPDWGFISDSVDPTINQVFHKRYIGNEFIIYPPMEIYEAPELFIAHLYKLSAPVSLGISDAVVEPKRNMGRLNI